MVKQHRSRLPRPVRVATWSMMAIVLPVVIALTAVLFLTDLCVVKQVTVEGAKVLTTEKVLSAAKVPQGERLATLDTHAIAVRVAHIPRVKRVRVEGQYPSTVLITVQERQGVAYFSAEGRLFEIDAEGVTMVVAKRPALLPQIVVPDPLHNTLQREAALVTSQKLPPDIVRRIKVITVTLAAMVVITLRDGRIVELGSPTRVDEKVRTMRLVLTQPGQVWNVSNPELPTRR